MSHVYQDADFAARCSEKTLQSKDKGFFLSLADNLADIAGNTWIEKTFVKLRSDREKLKILYEHEPVKNALTEVLSNVQHIYRKKSSEIAIARMEEAEKLLEKNELIRSLALYSQAVLRSQQSGENEIDRDTTLSLALFGRSKVLMDMDKYDLALADIQMALKENLPEHHKGEAFFKLAICYKAMHEEKKATVALRLSQKLSNQNSKILLKRFHNEATSVDKFQKEAFKEANLPQLSGKQNKVFPNAVDSLELKVTPALGRHLVCKGKIKTGDTLVVEAPYAACLVPEAFGTCCQHCFRRLIAPIGCPTCSNVAFCSTQCRDGALESYHKYECKILELLLGSGSSVLSYLALRMVTQKELSENLQLYENRKNEQVFSMCTNRDKRKANDFFRRTVMAAFLLRCLQKVGYFGEDSSSVIPTDREITIGEMLMFNLQMLQFNAHEIYEKIHPDAHRFKGAKINPIGVGLYPTVALFNHQCYPSVTRYFIGKNIVINSLRPLKNGEIIAENYGPIFTKRNLADRQKLLNSRYWFECECPACIQNWPMLTTKEENASVRFSGIKCMHLPKRRERHHRLQSQVAQDLTILGSRFGPKILVGNRKLSTPDIFYASMTRLSMVFYSSMNVQNLLMETTGYCTNCKQNISVSMVKCKYFFHNNTAKSTILRIKCPRITCENILCTLNKKKTKCSNCNDIVNLEDMNKKLQECVDQYYVAFEKMNEMKTTESIEILKNALDDFHKMALPPHKETHWAEETLKACFADSGNTFAVLTKTK